MLVATTTKRTEIKAQVATTNKKATNETTFLKRRNK